MMTIVLSACLIAHPGQCKDFRVPIDVDMDARQVHDGRAALFPPNGPKSIRLGVSCAGNACRATRTTSDALFPSSHEGQGTSEVSGVTGRRA